MHFRDLLEVFPIWLDDRTTAQPISAGHSGSDRGAGPVLRAERRRGLDPAPPRTCLEILIASRQGERREATIRTRADEAEILEILIMPN